MGQKDKFDPLYRALVDGLIKERKARGLTQAEVAQRMGTDQSQISKFERFERRIDIVDFIRYAGALEVEAPELLRRLFQHPGDLP